jgi:hypothetical protein
MKAILIDPEAGMFPVFIGKPTENCGGFFTVRWSPNLHRDLSLLPLAWAGADGEFDNANHWSTPPDTFRHSRYPEVRISLSPMLEHVPPATFLAIVVVVVVVVLVVLVVLAIWIDLHDFRLPTAVHLKVPADVFRI